MTWHVAGPSEYLVITGLFVKDVKIAKKAWVLVGQKWSKIDITPVNYSFDVSAMSSEKLQFTLPATYTIGPDAEDTDALRKYAKLVTAHEHHAPHVNKTVESIIEGETRVLAAGMAMEQIFKGNEEFKSKVKDGVQRELQKLGLHVYNANVMQLKDVEGHEYFSYLGKKAQKGVESQAKVDVAQAKYVGDTGAKEMEARTEQQNAKVEAETKKYKAEQEALVEQKKAAMAAETRVVVNNKEEEMGKVDNELALKKAKWKKDAAIANVEAEKETELRKTEMQAEVERKNAEAQVEKLRAEVVVQSTIKKEATQEEAKADLFRREREAEAGLYGRKLEAQAQESLANADTYAAKQAAEARLFAKVKEAEALRSRAAAVAYYVTVLSWAVIRVFAVLLLLMHVNSWLIVSRVPLPNSGTGVETSLYVPRFIINNAIFHYFLPSSTSPHDQLPTPHMVLDNKPHNHDDSLHNDNNFSIDPTSTIPTNVMEEPHE